MKRVKASGRSRGFSLVEVLCALLVLGFGLVGVTEGITLALRSSREAELETRAALLAASRMETLRAEGWITAGEETGDFGADFPRWSWRQEIVPAGIDGLFEVSVAVLLGGEEEVFELKTRLFEVPLTDAYGETGASRIRSAAAKGDATAPREAGREPRAALRDRLGGGEKGRAR